MRKYLLLAAFGVLAGCGGGAGGTQANSFTGVWVGTWSNSSGGSGTATVNIFSRGEIQGHLTNLLPNDQTITGTVTNKGIVTAYVTATETTSYGLAGNLSLNEGVSL